MGFITTGHTVVAYLTPLGAEYLAGRKKSANDLSIKYFSLSDPDSNYNILNRLGKGYVPDLTGEDTSCLRIAMFNGQKYNVYKDSPDVGTVLYYSTQKTSSATKTDCPSGNTGSIVQYTVADGKYTSSVSQADADAKAQFDIDNNTQANANANGVCTPIPVQTVYYSVAKTGTFFRSNCGEGYTANSSPYTVPAGTYSSIISQADADQQAQNDLTTNGPINANNNATCVPLAQMINYYNNPSQVPYVQSGLLMYRNGSEIFRNDGITSGGFGVYSGDQMTINVYHFPTLFPVLPNSTNTLRVVIGGAEVYNHTTSANIADVQIDSYSFTIIGGKPDDYYQIFNSSTSPGTGYRTDGLTTNDYTTPVGEGYSVLVFDNSTSQNVITVDNVLGGLNHAYRYNILNDQSTQNIYIRNKESFTITVKVTDQNGSSLGVFNVSPNSNNSFNAIKTGLIVNISRT